MRSPKDHITYCEWRERGETALGAFLRFTPYQYIWGPAALLPPGRPLLAVITLKAIEG